MIYEFLDSRPVFGETVFIAPSADIIGDVTIGEYSSVWFNVTVRGDVNWISIGDRTNIQDNASVHVTHQDRKSTRLNSSHVAISYAVFCLKKKKNKHTKEKNHTIRRCII